MIFYNYIIPFLQSQDYLIIYLVLLKYYTNIFIINFYTPSYNVKNIAILFELFIDKTILL